jgi:beta-lactamase class D
MFKIAIDLMGYDSGILRVEQTPTLPFQKGYIDWDPSWRVATGPDADRTYGWFVGRATKGQRTIVPAGTAGAARVALNRRARLHAFY